MSACVDAALAPVLDVLWSRGARTAYSCQELTPGWAQLLFDEPGQLEVAARAVIDVLTAAGDAGMLQRASGHGERYELERGGLVDGRLSPDAVIVTRRQPGEPLWRMQASTGIGWDQPAPADGSPGPGLVNYEWLIPCTDLPALAGYCRPFTTGTVRTPTSRFDSAG